MSRERSSAQAQVEPAGRTPSEWISRVLLGIAVAGCIFASFVLITTPSAYRSSTPVDAKDLGHNVASSWGRYNENVAEAEPVWTANEMVAAIGDSGPGDVVVMPGSESYLDTAAVQQAIAGSDLMVVVTPPSPLGAIETTRVRDNTVQKFWANERGIALVIVHGTYVYVPPSDLHGLIVITTPDPGIPARDGLLYGDATNAVTKAVAAVLETDEDDGPDEPAATTAEELTPTGRAPTEAELAPVLADLDSAGLHVAPGAVGPAELSPDWSAALGDGLKVAVFPTPAPGEYIDYLSALADEHPDTPILVVTGKWVQAVGIDEERALAVMAQTRGIGGFALASSPPDAERLLDVYSSVYQIATMSAQTYAGLPQPPEGIPRWIAFLVLGASLGVVAAFGIGVLLENRGRREPWVGWRSRVRGLLLDRYSVLSGAAQLSLADPADIKRARFRLDSAYSALLEVPGADTPMAAGRLIDKAWSQLDEAATALGSGDLAPSATLPDSDRKPTSVPVTLPPPEVPKKRRKQKRASFFERPSTWLVGTLVVVVGAVLIAQPLIEAADDGDDARADRAVEALAESSAVVGPDDDLEAVQAVIGTRSMMIVNLDDRDRAIAWKIGEKVASAYPSAIVFVTRNGDVVDAEVGRDAGVGGYDGYAIIDDYYDVKNAAGSDPVAQAAQLALLYDRLAAEGSINGIERRYYGAEIPWTIVAVGILSALAAAAFLINASVRRMTGGRTQRSEIVGQREGLQLRLAETARQLLDATAPTAVLSRFAERERRLLDRVSTAAPADLDELRSQVTAFDADVNRALAAEQGP